MVAFEFAFDIACPYSYLASLQVEQVAYRCGASIKWIPVLFDELHSHGQGKYGSLMDAMSPTKEKVLASDLLIQVKHIGAPFLWNSKHPLKTVTALTLILSAHETDRSSLVHTLFRAYWVQNIDIEDMVVLERVASEYGLSLSSINHVLMENQLHENTKRFSNMGASGLPSFLANGKLYCGQDRLIFVEKALGVLPTPRRLLRFRTGHEPRTLVFYHDFGSPYSYLASLQVEQLVKETGAKLVYKPIFLGALLRSIKTNIAPVLAQMHTRIFYPRKDIEDWSDYLHANLNFPSIFPIKTVLALRVAICDTSVTNLLYQATWVNNKDISDATVLHEILNKGGWDADRLLRQANTNETKQTLRYHTSEAQTLGACGVPTFLVLDQDGQQVSMLWGQDRLNVLEDILVGWNPGNNIACTLKL